MLAALLATTLVLPTNAACVQTSGGTVAIGRSTSAGWVVQTSTDGRPCQTALGPSREVQCPDAVAAAPDGTAAVAISNLGDHARLVVRRPDGTFERPVPVDLIHDGALHLAAAPGGHATAVWQRLDERRRFGELQALAFRPGGTVTRTRLARVTGDLPLFPAVVSRPDGTATVAWSEPGRPVRKRYADWRGGRWSAPIDLYAATDVGPLTGGVALAQAPGGRRLMAWSTTAHLHLAVQGEGTTTIPLPLWLGPREHELRLEDGRSALVRPGPVSAFSSALADDGSAAVLLETGTGTFAVDRGPDRRWSTPHRLPRPIAAGSAPELEIAPGGRVLVVWSQRDGRIISVTGRAGGRWGGAKPLAAPLPIPAGETEPEYRLVHLAGDGWVVWTDRSQRLQAGYAGTAHSDALTAWISSRMSLMPTVTAQPG